LKKSFEKTSTPLEGALWGGTGKTLKPRDKIKERTLAEANVTRKKRKKSQEGEELNCQGAVNRHRFSPIS